MFALRRLTKPLAWLAGPALCLVGTPVVAARAVAPPSWTVAKSPNPGTADDSLTSVACLSAADCWAVGSQDSGASAADEQPLVEHSDSTRWSVVPSAKLEGGEDQAGSLSGVACTGPTNCWAVGDVLPSDGPQQPLFEHWDGSRWAASVLSTGSALNYFVDGVTCAGAKLCWAVGYTSPQPTAGPPRDTTWVARWDGTAWASQPGTHLGALDGVACTGPTSCWAVGQGDTVFDGGTSKALTTLVEAWDGVSWTARPSPDHGNGDNALNAVSCTSPRRCWAVGYWSRGTGDSATSSSQNLFLTWDGVSWAIASGTQRSDDNAPKPNLNSLSGVDCLVGTCWAVGGYSSGSASAYKTLIDVWDGQAWSLASGTPNANDNVANSLSSIACADVHHCVAVGGYGLLGSGASLVLQCTGHCAAASLPAHAARRPA
jgi:hypothetical protein